VPFGNARVHLNWGLPDLSEPHIVVLSTYATLTGQWLMRRLRGKRWLFWGERLRRNSGLKDLIQRGLASPISQASGIVAIGRAAEEDYRRRFPNLRHFCIPYHCDLSSFHRIRPNRELGAPLTFLFCGQMIRRKGVDLLLRAFDRLVAEGFDARLLLVGREADLPSFLELVSPTTLSKIQYEGFQDPECLPESFAKSDVFVLPSRQDGWGVVINQALGASLPIITSNAVGAGLDLVDNGYNGICVPANDEGALYQAMKVFVSNPELARQWGERSLNRAHDLTPKAGAEKWVRAFDSFIRDGRENVEGPVTPKMEESASPSRKSCDASGSDPTSGSPGLQR
jgi:glycosyltransferase involved in cell wall biosynthesis